MERSGCREIVIDPLMKSLRNVYCFLMPGVLDFVRHATFSRHERDEIHSVLATTQFLPNDLEHRTVRRANERLRDGQPSNEFRSPYRSDQGSRERSPR